MLGITCNSQKSNCEQSNSEELKLWPINASFKLPPYLITDSTKFGKETILNYNIKSIDSSLNVIASIKNYENPPPAQFDLKQHMLFAKQEIQFNRKVDKLTETFKDIDTLRAGYLKYMVEQKDKKSYEGRIFFYKDKKLVELWLFENYNEDKDKEHLIMDCVLQSIKFY